MVNWERTPMKPHKYCLFVFVKQNNRHSGTFFQANLWMKSCGFLAGSIDYLTGFVLQRLVPVVHAVQLEVRRLDTLPKETAPLLPLHLGHWLQVRAPGGVPHTRGAAPHRPPFTGTVHSPSRSGFLQIYFALVLFVLLGSGSALEWKARSGSPFNSIFRSFGGSEWSLGGPCTLTMEAWMLRIDPWRVCRPEAEDSHHFWRGAGSGSVPH